MVLVLGCLAPHSRAMSKAFRNHGTIFLREFCFKMNFIRGINFLFLESMELIGTGGVSGCPDKIKDAFGCCNDDGAEQRQENPLELR